MRKPFFLSGIAKPACASFEFHYAAIVVSASSFSCTSRNGVQAKGVEIE
jgi:hypothetical protein